MRRFFRRSLAVISIGIAALALTAAPAQAQSNQNCHTSGSAASQNILQICLIYYAVDVSEVSTSESYFELQDEVLINKKATSGDHCYVTGWSTVWGLSGPSWETPHYVKSCDEALRQTTPYSYTMISTYTAGWKFLPHGCLTITWNTSSYVYQDCFDGYQIVNA